METFDEETSTLMVGSFQFLLPEVNANSLPNIAILEHQISNITARDIPQSLSGTTKERKG